ncbi:MAG: bifunctional aminotransferase class I/II-fold pyridoxal phosphate-dependent enzyme/GNAT family N-acetyltransferase [Cyclobacteriaceae bacterium]|nr:bifunctional aminotransferase class I/II-fold pyridoxal phosphate-dependent enzyme/GNAT family N-acetyltransferase [Cyclobacteriaceae bacterium]
MAKIRHNNVIDTVVEVFSVAKGEGTLHLYAEDEQLDGRHLTINGNKALHFGTCGYMGLDQHHDLKKGAIEAIEQFGVQFPMSKSYVSNPLYSKLEKLLINMYDSPIAISKNCTLSHLAVIPTIIKPSDLIILDHQVHTSVQEVSKKMLSQGVKVEMIRHSNMDMLENMIKKHRNNFDKIWYMADGVYSMYGDFAPIKEMIQLAEKYEQLYLYVDDAHGMSWAGKNGAGYVMSQMDKLYNKMILTTTMGKGFGCAGGITVFPNKEWSDKVKLFGGPLTFSVQMEPPILGAAIASAQIHLSDQIKSYQDSLQEKILYCNDLMKKSDLPIVAVNNSPLFFIGAGTMVMANDLIKRLLKNGIYMNLAPYPAVPAKNIGVRISISMHNTMDDIKTMVAKLKIAFDESLRETGQTRENIIKAFKLKNLKIDEPQIIEEQLIIDCNTSITDIDKELWNNYLGLHGMFDWDGLVVLEKSFSNNNEKENNWAFKYYTIKDNEGNIILMTFFVVALYKEDMFSRVSISKAMEEIRLKDPYYFTSKAIIMGTLRTEGSHMYVNRENSTWKQALKVLFKELYKVQESEKASNIILRDFDAYDDEINEFMLEQSFVKVDMPVSCVTENISWNNEEEFTNGLSKKNRRNFKLEIKKFEHFFDVEIKEQLSDEDLLHTQDLFEEVKNKNLGLNTFHTPYKALQEMNDSDSYEFIVLYIKKEYTSYKKPVGVGLCHKNTTGVYTPSTVGLNYDYVYEFGVYRQMLYQVAKRAQVLGYSKINWGLSATIEKKKVGAALFPKVAFVQAMDNYAQEMMEATTFIEKD